MKFPTVVLFTTALAAQAPDHEAVVVPTTSFDSPMWMTVRQRKEQRRHLLQRFESCDEAFGSILPAGIWTSRGYGYVIQVADDGTCTIYQESEISCIEDINFFNWFLIGNVTLMEDDTVVGIDHDQQVDFLYDRSDVFQSGCANGVTPSVETSTEDMYEPDALRTFDFFYQAFVEGYIFFDARGVDWDAVTTEARATLSSNSTTEELFEAMSSCLAPLRDYHATLDFNGTTFESKPLTIFGQLIAEWLNQEEIADPEEYTVTQAVAWVTILASYMDEGSFGGTPLENVWGTMDNGTIAYLQLNGVGFGIGEGTFFDTLDQLFSEDWVNIHTLILDMRVNGGGDDRTGLGIASYFVREPTLAFRKRAWIHATQSWTPTSDIYIQPNTRVQFPGQNVILIFSDSCGSACEVLAITMMQTPAYLTSLGRNTIGALSYQLERRMDNNFYVDLSNEEYSDPMGNVYEVVGVPPLIVTETDLLPLEERQQGFDSWLELALQFARDAAPSGSPPAPVRDNSTSPASSSIIIHAPSACGAVFSFVAMVVSSLVLI